MPRLSLLAFTVVFTIPTALAIPFWGQCAGVGGTNSATVCDAGSTCVAQSPNYSQCVPNTIDSEPDTDPSLKLNASLVIRQSSTFPNPPFWEDFADNDVTRVGDVFYFSSSSMHYSPGAPILRSYDLVNWEWVGHSVPRLDFGSDDYNLPPGRQAYIQGVWASAMKYRKSTDTWYWIGCVDFSKTYIYTSKSTASGPWTKAATLNKCYYDVGLLIDDDDTMYVCYGQNNIQVAQLTADGLGEVRNQVVWSTDIDYIEGSRIYKRNGVYYILITKPNYQTHMLKSSGNVWGPYTRRPLSTISSPIIGGSGPHQGSLVDTQNGLYFSFDDSLLDDCPFLCTSQVIGITWVSLTLTPITWSSDGWPSLVLVNSAWGQSYPYPLTPHLMPEHTGIRTFSGSSLAPEWEWNHNPDNNNWSIGSTGLILKTASVTDDLYAARNTLTHRIIGPKSSGTIRLDLSSMADGDRAGLAMLRDNSAYIAVKRSGNTKTVVMVNGLAMKDADWSTTNKGSEVASASFSGNEIWLRAQGDMQPTGNKQATFYWSSNGSQWNALGPAFTMNTNWTFFFGYRFGIFNFATRALGGSVVLKSFEMQKI
ncbi:hypothetical protein VNI00_013938 [Paramarasmius palmivorus]|uniref:CBM1 domain-containing protein n=1 Tax=Paramarasmius palmivorus TaxID=297713 RepID=A0AAW0BVL9_9AGAR